MITRICKHCNIEYNTYPSINKIYCSHKCASEAKKKGNFEKCAQCGNEFWKFVSKPNTIYCSKSCARTAANLTDKNPSYHRNISGENNPMFGKKRFGKDNPMFGKRGNLNANWKGGKTFRKDGYVRIAVSSDHPHPCEIKNGTSYVLEHRFVMEQSIGRYLEPNEVVHHIDRNPSNNAIENLILFKNQAEHIAIAHSS